MARRLSVVAFGAMTGTAAKTADALADVVLPDQDGNDVRLGDLWRDRPAVLVWLRHYG
jgi:hypothetical protein